MITERRWKQICYTILAVLVPFLVAVGLNTWSSLGVSVITTLQYGTIMIWLALIWRPRRA